MINRIYYILKAIYKSSNFAFSRRIKLILSTIFETSFFLPLLTAEEIQIEKYEEVLPYIDNFLFGEILEPVYLSYLKAQNNPVIVDLGCNTGVLAEYYLKSITNVTYYMFDMMKECIENCRQRLLHYSNSVKIQYFNLALGNENKNIEISFDNPINSSNTILSHSSSNKRFVEMRRLDDIKEIKYLKKIDLLKIDVEGYELPVLNGSLETIKKSEFSIVELHLQKHIDDYSEIINIFSTCGLHLYKVKSRNLFFKKSI
jgi:FkbM family methyltransferase